MERLPVDGCSLAVRKSGDRRNPCLVLLHGWPQTGLAWEAVLADLGGDFYALAFDLPGVGDSVGAPPSGEKTVIADLILKAAEAAGGRSIIVAGYDVGGMVAFACARDHAARIDGAVVMNTVLPGVEPWSKIIADPRIWHFAFHAIPDLPELLVTGHERPYFDYFYDFMAADPRALSSRSRAAYAHGYSRREALTAGFDWYRAFEKDAAHNGAPARIDTPMLYLRGDAGGRDIEDYVAGLRKAGATRLQSGVLPHSGEYAPEEAAEHLVPALRALRRACDAATARR